MSNELINIPFTGARTTASDSKIVTLKLGISQQQREKLKKLNEMNIEKERSQDLNKNDRTMSSTDNERSSVKDHDVSSGNYIDVFGSMQCP